MVEALRYVAMGLDLSGTRKMVQERSALRARRRFYESRPQARVVGIQGRPELNGRLVRVGELVEAIGRFRVLVPASDVATGGAVIIVSMRPYCFHALHAKQTGAARK